MFPCNNLPGSNSWGGGEGSKVFDDPFLLPSTDYAPQSMSDAFDFCRYLYNLNPEYRQASKRVTRHFIQQFELKGLSGEEQEEVLDYLTYKIALPSAIMEMADDWSVYGNAFMRIKYPFKRLLTVVGAKKKVWYDIDTFPLDSLKFDLKKLVYTGKDPRNPTQNVTFDFHDVKQKEKDGIRIIKVDPRDMDILYSEQTRDKKFLYNPPAALVNDVNNNNIFQINNLSKKMLIAIRDKKSFLFNENEVFHFHAPIVSGFSTGGWGLPEPIANFRLLYQIQVYRKIDEVVGQDYMLPFRIISADAGNGGASQKLDIRLWKREMQEMVRVRRKDKKAIFTLPFPINYQEEGATGKALTPKELIQFQIENMLNAMGYPAELYNMSLNIDQMPTAIRLFENTFWFIHEGYNNFCRWVVARVNSYLNNQRFDISMARPSMANDIDKQNILLQLGAQGEIPRQMAMRSLGISDPVEAYRARIKEDIEFKKIEIEAEQNLEKELDAQASLSAALQTPEDLAQGGGGNTPQDMEEKAMAEAQRLGAIESDGERAKAMDALKVQNFQLYTMAKQLLDEMRAQGASEGRQMANQQMVEGGGG